MRRGQLRVIEAAAAGVLAILVLATASRLTYPRTTYVGYSDYAAEAAAILKVLAGRNVLCRAVYGPDGSVAGDALKAAVEGFLPPEKGYRISVNRLESGKVEEIYVFESGNFALEKASSSYVILSGCNGVFEPRMVVLSVSGSD